MTAPVRVTETLAKRIAAAARDRSPIVGYTHNFYRYPARFSPAFAAAAIECFSKPGDVVCEPYMGGGTGVVQALAMGRHVVGNDLNSLSNFITKVKVTPLSRRDITAIIGWAENIVPTLTYRGSSRALSKLLNAPETKNLSLDRGRFIKKLVASALRTLDQLPTQRSSDFVRCALLCVGQWALDGRKTHTSLAEFRDKLGATTLEMLNGIEDFRRAIESHDSIPAHFLSNGDAAHIDELPIFAVQGRRASLVVTSPPYPGVHVLYHRWQVDGRRESPAPYWIANRMDGEGYAYYNFGGREEQGAITYFSNSLKTLRAIRNTMIDGGIMVQMIAFGDPTTQLPLYLQNMTEAGFREIVAGDKRIWRQVPHRKWHATMQGKTHSAREAVLIHRAI